MLRPGSSWYRFVARDGSGGVGRSDCRWSAGIAAEQIASGSKFDMLIIVVVGQRAETRSMATHLKIVIAAQFDETNVRWERTDGQHLQSR